MKNYIDEIIKRKDLMLYLVTSGLKSKHRNTFLGYLWWLLDPLLSVLIYYFLVVIVLERGGPDYPAFLVVGLVVFRWLTANVNGSAKSISSKSAIVTQVYIPKAILPIGESITQLINFLFGLVVIAIFLIFYRIIPGVEIVWLPFIIFVQFLFHVAISLFMGYVCIFVSDIQNIITHAMRILRYASPVIWEIDSLPVEYQWIVEINPFSKLLNAYRDVLIYGQLPDFTSLIAIGLGSLVFIGYMLFYYNKNEHKIIKVL